MYVVLRTLQILLKEGLPDPKGKPPAWGDNPPAWYEGAFFRLTSFDALSQDWVFKI